MFATSCMVFSRAKGRPQNLPYVQSGKLMLNGGVYRFVGGDCIDLGAVYTGTELTESAISSYFALWPANTMHRCYFPQEYGGGSVNTSGYDQLQIVERQAALNNQKLIVALATEVGGSHVTFDATWYTTGYTGTDAAHSWGATPFGSHTTNYLGWINTVCSAYKNSKAIAVWEIMNEGMTQTASGITVAQATSFYNAAASAIKAADPNHLVSTGMQGVNEQWSLTAANWETVCGGTNIDLITVHEYSYAYQGQITGSSQVSTACQVGAALNKPVYVGESGIGNTSGSVTLAQRQAVYGPKLDIFFGKTQDATNTPNAYTWPCCGVLYWDFASTYANAGTVTNAAFNDEPMTGGAGSMLAYIAAYNPYAPSSGASGSGGAAAVIPYSANTEIPNPSRGQYDDQLTGLYWQGTTYAVNDKYQRYLWSQIQPTSQTSFTWTAIDNDIAAAASAGARFGIRIMMAPASNAVPTWATSVSGATQSLSGHTVPVWNNSAYLSLLQNLISAIGARYDLDERLAYFEISGYGDFSQMNCGTEIGWGLSCPTEANSISVLGYECNTYSDILTSLNVQNVIGYHVAAFPNTRLITQTHPEFVRQLTLGTRFDGTTVTKPTIPAGLRYDGMCTEDQYFVNYAYPAGTAAGSHGDYYAGTAQATAYLNNWKKAPFMTEYDNYYGAGSYPVGGTTRNTPAQNSTSYFPVGLQECVNYHISFVSSGMAYYLPNNVLSGLSSPLSSTNYGIYLRTIMYSGYRYSASTVVTAGAVTVTWTNWGVAPAYDKWQIVYQVRNSSGTVVQTVNSSYSFLTLAATDYPSLNWGGYQQGLYTSTAPTSDPTPITGTDTFTVSGSLTSGSYSIWVLVNWAQHKPGATTTFNASPMGLAMSGRDTSGAYQIGTFTV